MLVGRSDDLFRVEVIPVAVRDEDQIPAARLAGEWIDLRRLIDEGIEEEAELGVQDLNARIA